MVFTISAQFNRQRRLALFAAVSCLCAVSFLSHSAAEIVLNSGNVVRGTIVRETCDLVVIQMDAGSGSSLPAVEIPVSRENIRRINRNEAFAASPGTLDSPREETIASQEMETPKAADSAAREESESGVPSGAEELVADNTDTPTMSGDIPVPDPATLAAVQTALKTMVPNDAASRDEAIEAIEALGDPALPCLLHLLMNQERGETGRIAVDLFVKLGESGTIPWLKQLLEAEDSTHHDLAIRLLRGIESPDASALLIGYVIHKQGPAYFAARRTLVSILQHESSGQVFDQLVSRYNAEQPGQARRIAECLGESRRRYAAQFLQNRLGDAEGFLKVSIIKALAGQGFADPDAGDAIRDYLFDTDPQLRRVAAGALGSLMDIRSIPDLIHLLEEEDEALREIALRSLQYIAGKRYARPEKWARWWQVENERASMQVGVCFSHLEAEQESLRIQGIQGLANQILYREQAARRIIPFLYRGSAAEAKAACETLTRLKPRSAIGPLVVCLEIWEQDEEVNSAAWQALCAITGETLPQNAAAWNAWLERR